MKMRVKTKHITESLMSYDHSGVYLFTGNFPVEIADHGEYHFRNFGEEPSVVAEEHPQGFRKGEDELSMRKTEEDLLTQMLGEEERPFLAAAGAQIKPLAGEGAEIVVTWSSLLRELLSSFNKVETAAVGITTADAGYTLPVVTADEKVLSYRLDPFEAKLTECIGILLIIPAAEIGEMTLEDLMECVSSPRKVLRLLVFQYGSILYTHIEYYCENGTDASGNIK